MMLATTTFHLVIPCESLYSGVGVEWGGIGGKAVGGGRG